MISIFGRGIIKHVEIVNTSRINLFRSFSSILSLDDYKVALKEGKVAPLKSIKYKDGIQKYGDGYQYNIGVRRWVKAVKKLKKNTEKVKKKDIPSQPDSVVEDSQTDDNHAPSMEVEQMEEDKIEEIVEEIHIEPVIEEVKEVKVEVKLSEDEEDEDWPLDFYGPSGGPPSPMYPSSLGHVHHVEG